MEVESDWNERALTRGLNLDELCKCILHVLFILPFASESNHCPFAFQCKVCEWIERLFTHTAHVRKEALTKEYADASVDVDELQRLCAYCPLQTVLLFVASFTKRSSDGFKTAS